MEKEEEKPPPSNTFELRTIPLPHLQMMGFLIQL